MEEENTRINGELQKVSQQKAGLEEQNIQIKTLLEQLKQQLVEKEGRESDKIKQIETSNQDVGVCQTTSNEGKN